MELINSIRENLTFVAVSLAITVFMTVIAKISEKLIGMKKDPTSHTRKITCIAIFSAIAGVLMILEFPIAFIAPEFYKLDFSELPILILSMAYGPVAGVVAEFIKVVLKIVIKGTSTAFVGDLANFLVGCFLILPASIIYHIRKSKKSAIVGLIVGSVSMTIFGSLFNAVYLIPAFANLFGIPLEVIVSMGTAINPRITSVWSLVAWAVIPFNLMKSVLDSVLTFLLYKKLSPIIHKAHN